jgi:Fe-S cluster biogenesis protein NfuA
MTSQPNLHAIGDRIERLLDDIRASEDRRAIANAEDLLRLVTELYGAGLARIIDVVAQDSPGVMDTLRADELVSSLLTVHDIHPDPLPARVDQALTSVRPFLAQHGGDVELVDIDIEAGAVLLRLLGSCDGCPSSSVTLQHAVERAILDAAPEIGTIDVEQSKPDAPTINVAIGPKPIYDECPTEALA